MQTDGYFAAASILPAPLCERALDMRRHWENDAEEFRLRAGREATVLAGGEERRLFPGRTLTQGDLRKALEKATEASLHTAAESIRQGFVTTRSGCRVGVCGTVSPGTLRSFSSLAVRIPRQHRGAADGIFAEIKREGFRSTLIISPPGGGKTTLLRELVRLLSEGGSRVSVADERGEVAAMNDGVAGFDIGPFTDVMTGGAKAESVISLLRSMNPEIIALDEITAPADIEACEMASNCGVHLLATAHGADIEDLRDRPLYRKLLERRVFRQAVVIHRQRGERSYGLRCLE